MSIKNNREIMSRCIYSESGKSQSPVERTTANPADNGEPMASQDIVLPAQRRSAAAYPSEEPGPYPKLDSAGHTPIGVHLDIEERRLAEFYLAEGQRLGHMGI